MMSNYQHPLHNRLRHSSRLIYTYHLPYGIRRDICNLLDADQSWRTLGGQFIGLDTTQLTLIGQAYMRNGSPTDELLNKLDSANVRISELCFYLEQMNHCRALEILKPCLNETTTGDAIYPPLGGVCPSTDVAMVSGNSTLDTPTPSFTEQPAVMMCNEMATSVGESHQWAALPPPVEQFDSPRMSNHNAPSKCHRSTTTTKDQPLSQQQEPENNTTNHLNHQRLWQPDPGEEIVRMACANNRKRTSISDQEVVNQLRLIMQINYSELKQASDDFSDSKILGNGGFASVYRGHWKGTDVAIKRLRCNLMDQALNELTILNSYRIDNILPIYGISIDGPEACLVYQFMANGSLEDRLSCKKDTPPLTWNQRALIGEGVAKGLYYLHTLRDKPLVHGDVKSANVLLDSQFVPKLGDFGLARQVFKGKNLQTELCTHCTVSSIHGTSVYLPPEYLRHKILSPAVDVYSYGIVLLEMATGKRAYDGKRLLIDLVEDETRSMSMGQIGYSLKDSRLADDTQSDLKIWYELLIKLGLNCAHKIKRKRPDMGEVLSRFADFRINSDFSDDNSIGSPMLALSSSINGSTTARTLTPGLDTPDKTNPFRRQRFGTSTSTTPKPTTNSVAENATATRHEMNRAAQNSNNNSSLMNIDEESSINGVSGGNADGASNNNPNHNVDQAVAAMIPLLTELGVKSDDRE